MKIKGSALCSGRNVAGWRMANVQPSIFFTYKKNYNKKTISELRLKDKSTTCNEKEIIDQIEAYFKILYSSENTFSQEKYEEFIHSLKVPRLRSNEDRDSLEGPLTYEECKNFTGLFPKRQVTRNRRIYCGILQILL